MTSPAKSAGLSQWFTPVWAADLLVQQFFGDLTERDHVLEPSAGKRYIPSFNHTPYMLKW